MHRANELALSLRQAIERGIYRAGQALPSERELCAREGVSRTTVRRAIQQLVDAGLLYRLPGSGTYVAEPVGHPSSALRQPATIGLILPTLGNPFFGELAMAIERESRRAGYQILLAQSDFVVHSEASFLTNFAENPQVKGVITSSISDVVPVESYSQLTSHHKPFLFVVRDAEAIAADSVSTDHVGGARALMQHLLMLGHRRIAYIGIARERTPRHFLGYCEALRAANISLDPALQVQLSADNLQEVGVQGVQLLRERGVSYTAIFAQIDQIALGVLRGLRAAQLRVPQDVSVVGFDNISSAEHVDPPLTTVDHTVGEIGRLAVVLLQDRMLGRYDGPPRRVVIQPQLIIRASCALPAVVQQPI